MRGRLVAQRGSVTAFMAVFFVALLAVCGLVIDGGRAISDKRRAIEEARGAARAAAGALAVSPLRQRGDFSLQPDVAERAAQAYLTQTGHQGSVSVFDDRVEVRVRVRRRSVLLGALGVGEISVEGVGRARALHGVTREEP